MNEEDMILEEEIQDAPAEETLPEEIPEEIVEEPQQAQYTDEELDNYAFQRVAMNPNLAKKFSGYAGDTPPAPEERQPIQVPFDIQGTAEEIEYVANHIADQKLQAALAPITQQLEDMRYQGELATASGQIAKTLGGDHYVEPIKQILSEAGPKGLEMYQSNPQFKSLVNDAAAHRAARGSKPVVREQKPLPKPDSGVGVQQSGYSASDRDFAEKFDRDFADLGLTYKDVTN